MAHFLIYENKWTYMLLVIIYNLTLLLTNPFSDLVNLDCLNLNVSWNETLKLDRATKTRPLGITFFKTKMSELIRTEFDSLKWNENLKPVSVPI